MIKTYTFTLPKNNTSNNSAKVKNSLMDKILNAYPWMAGNKEPKKSGITTIVYDIAKCNNTCANCPFNNMNCYSKPDIFDLETEFFSAISSFKKFAKDYDFEDEYGNPVRIFDNFIQVGYEVIPIIPGSLNYLKPAQKKTIIDITIKIKNNGWC